MPRFDTVDRLELNAPAEQLFEIIRDYPRMHEWYPPYRVQVEGGGAVVEILHDRWDLSETSFPGGTPSTLAGNDLEGPLASGSNENRLHDAIRPDRSSQLRQSIGIE